MRKAIGIIILLNVFASGIWAISKLFGDKNTPSLGYVYLMTISAVVLICIMWAVCEITFKEKDNA